MLHTSNAPTPFARRVKLAALFGPLAALAVVAACNESASATPTAPTASLAGEQTSTVSGGGGGKAPGGVRAYAFVHTVGPSLDAERSRGFAAVTSPAQGVFCLTPSVSVSPETAPAIVGAATNFYNLPVWDQQTIPTCAAGQYRVVLWDINAWHLTNLYGFTIMIP